MGAGDSFSWTSGEFDFDVFLPYGGGGEDCTLPRGFSIAVPVSLTVPLGAGTMLPTTSLRYVCYTRDTTVCTHAISTLDDRSRQVFLP